MIGPNRFVSATKQLHNLLKILLIIIDQSYNCFLNVMAAAILRVSEQHTFCQWQQNKLFYAHK